MFVCVCFGKAVGLNLILFFYVCCCFSSRLRRDPAQTAFISAPCGISPFLPLSQEPCVRACVSPDDISPGVGLAL